ncbi:MAG: outer membrane protein assembly factor BamE [Candidatus Azotimanducaceae bacterium]|jgi:outer membrane protein assembly factor BamE|tara:strand:- start:1523 stop:2014 length:492 start_codon:yes stop_codon:yes gene_type:complete
MKHLIISAVCITLLGGCGLFNLKLSDIKIPRVYKIPVQQGNVITQEMVNRLKPGMTRNQVSFVLGDTVNKDPFEQNRWVYLYTLEVPDFFNQKIKLILDFEDDLLTTISGDMAPIAEKEETAEVETEAGATVEATVEETAEADPEQKAEIDAAPKADEEVSSE